MAWAFVSAACNGAGSQNTLAKSVTTGNLLVFVREMQTSSDTPAISDGVNTWTQMAASPFQDVPDNAGLAMWWAIAATTASITVTVTGSTNSGFAVNALAEYSGNAAASLEDGSNGAAHIAATTATDGQATGSVTTVADGDLIISVIGDGSGAPTIAQYTAGTGFTKRATASQDPGGAGVSTFAWEDKVQTTHGAINPTWTATQADTAVGFTAAFKVLGGAPSNTLWAASVM